MDLDFKLDNTQYLTHGIHPYPAKMIPQVANKLIQEYGRKANVLFDPFCGSGTVLLEAKLNNIHSIGFELNPLARLIASVKTTNIEQKTLELFLKDFHDYIFEIIYYPLNHKPVIVKYPNIDYWFSKKVQRNLTSIKTYINTIDNPQVKNFFLVAFGKTVRFCSWTRNDEFKLYKMPIEKIRHFKPEVFSIMEQTLAQNYLGITQFANVVNNEIISNIYNANSSKYIPRRLIKDESIDLVITSPPYGDSATTVSYGQFSALPNEWIFEMATPRNLDKLLMGGLKAKRINNFASDILNTQISEMAKIDIKRTLEITGFYRDYFKSIRNISKTVKKQGFVCYVVSNRTVITATNEPQHITAVGAPDFRIIKKKLATGYVECKDIGINLDEVIKTEQLQRYLKSFHNLLITDYLEFRWYVGGKLRLKQTLGTLVKNKIKQDKDNLQGIEELLTSFLNNEPEPIGSPKELAGHMARLAHMIREIIIKVLQQELATGGLHAQWHAFRENLIPELSVEQFADMYAQTIAYGLFAARCEDDYSKDFSRQQAAYLIPKTNPFLRKLFNYIAGPELDESIMWAVDDLAQILAWADMDAVLKNFGKSTGKQDPVVHFYETFLKEYDPKTREMRGVYYTPLPVVSYIVRSIDHILKTSFDKPQGLADPSVLVLDPAVGTATFLYMVMQEIHDAVIKQGQAGIWDDYVAKKLLPRLFGFELLMAPYAIAHLKLGRLLKETGYQFQTDQRLGIYLTNTLEEAVKHTDTMFAQWITEESNAAADIKKSKPVMVILGNPPYSVSSSNKSEYIEKLMDSYKTSVRTERNIQPLSDDYIKFIRFAQERIERTGYGTVGMITNHAYLSGLIHRGMREQLLTNFDDIWILDLHGNSKKGEISPDHEKDENVFDIQQGVAILLASRNKNHDLSSKFGQVFHADLWGLRESKYEFLATDDMRNVDWEKLKPSPPNYFFIPRETKSQSEFEEFPSIVEIFPIRSSGMNSLHDAFVISFERESLISMIQDALNKNITNIELRNKYDVADSRDWKLDEFRERISNLSLSDLSNKTIKCLYRPFDQRWIVLNDSFVGYARWETTNHFLSPESLGFATTKQTQQSMACLCSRIPFGQHKIVDPYDRSYIFPLYIYPAEGEMQLGGGLRRPNLNAEFIKTFSEKLGLKFIEDGKGDLQQTFGPEDIFNYAYAVFHSPEYRSRYAEFLKIDFPRLPLTSNKALFKSLAEKGAVLVSLHLMESPLLNNLITRYEVKGDHTVEKVGYDEKTHRVSINKTQYFDGVPPEVWSFHIGGYQVCEKWLKDRQKAQRKLTIEDIDHYQKIVVALKETIRLMSEIDETIKTHGGWPGAFE